MKKSLLFAAVALAAMTACQDNVVPETPAGNPETYTVKLACAGELEVNHVPLKSSSDDLYGIQVYYAPVSGGSYQPYAYGLFDDVSDVSLELIADYKYKFVVDLIIDGKNVVYSSNLNELDDPEVLLGFGAPFNKWIDYYNQELTPITNEFVTSTDWLLGLGGKIQLKDGVTYRGYPKDVDVYYGHLTDYVPEEDGATIAIYMKHMIFGLKVVADNFLTQGVVEGVFSDNIGDSGCCQDPFTLTPPSATVYEATYAYTDRENWYKYDVQNDAYNTCQIQFTWVKDENTTLKLDRQNIKMIRMKQTVVNVTFYEDESAGNTKVSMVFDDLEMSENETSYTFGDDQEEYEW